MPALSPDAAREEQQALAGLALPLAARALAVLDPEDLPGTVPPFRDMLEAIVEHYGRAAAGAASEWFKALRAEHVKGRAVVAPVALTPPGFLDEATVLGGVQALAPGPDVLSSQVEQLVLEQGRRQLMSAVRLDDAARGWTRVPNPGACSFCLMLASRGPVYKSKRGASFSAHTMQPNGSGGDCRCGVEPVFGAWEPSARVRDAQALWAESTKGRSGHDARAAFRQAVEGRPVTGLTRGEASKRKVPTPETLGKTSENQRFQLQLLESLPPAKTPAAAAWRVRRVAEIRKLLGE